MERVDKLLPTVILKMKKGLLRRPVHRLHPLEASSTKFVSGEFGDSVAYCGESASQKVKKKAKKKQVTQKRASNIIGEEGRMFRPGSLVNERHDPL